MARVVEASDLSLFDVWHQRLGHPSERVVKMLPQIQPCTTRENIE